MRGMWEGLSASLRMFRAGVKAARLFPFMPPNRGITENCSCGCYGFIGTFCGHIMQLGFRGGGPGFIIDLGAYIPTCAHVEIHMGKQTYLRKSEHSTRMLEYTILVFPNVIHCRLSYSIKMNRQKCCENQLMLLVLINVGITSKYPLP